jgi:membrane-associated protease RseP (regulator of RpoE activity)
MVLEFLGSDWVTKYQWVLLFYLGLLVLVILLRKRFEWHGIVGMYKTKVGLGAMQRLGTKYRELVKLLGYIGIGVAFLAMLYITGYLLWGVYQLIANPLAPPVVTPVLPGVQIPGAQIQVPLVIGWIVLFIVIVIHEFSHGVVARAHDVPVKSSGLMVLGVLGGAFVEPDEKKLKKQPDTVQYSIFAAGPFSNIVTAALFLAVLAFVLNPIYGAATHPAGIGVASTTPGYPMAQAGVVDDTLIMSVNDQPVLEYADLTVVLDPVKPGDAVKLGTDRGEYVITATANPDEAITKGYLGFMPENRRSPAVLAVILDWFIELFKWLVILSLGLGLANLFPVLAVDGGRMLQIASRKMAGNDKRGDWWWMKIGLVVIGIILVLLLVPIGRALF